MIVFYLFILSGTSINSNKKNNHVTCYNIWQLIGKFCSNIALLYLDIKISEKVWKILELFLQEERIVALHPLRNARMGPWVLQVHKELRIGLGCFRKKDLNMNLSRPILTGFNEPNKRDFTTREYGPTRFFLKLKQIWISSPL